MKRMLPACLIMMLVAVAPTPFAHAGASDPLKGIVMSSIAVKEANADRMTVHLQVQNATGADMQLWIRDDTGDVIYKERLQAGNFEKIFHLGMNEGERFRFDIRQGKVLVKTKEVRVVRKVEEVIEVQSFAAPNLAYRR
jgi:hypothetical protein